MSLAEEAACIARAVSVNELGLGMMSTCCGVGQGRLQRR